MAEQGHLISASRFQRFAYADLKRVTRGFSEEIGWGSGGMVYKGTLYDDQAATIKKSSFWQK